MRGLRTTLVVAISAILIGGAAAGFVAWRDGRLNLSPVRRTVTFSSRPVLARMRDLGQLETVRSIQRFVFPHDFLLSGVTTEMLLRRVAAAGRPAADVLSPAEQRHLRASLVATAAGLPVTREGRSFVVVTAQVVAGYDLTAPPFSSPDGAALLRDTAEEVTFYLPEASVLEVQIEDLSRERYPYPPVPIDAEGWRAVSTFVRAEASAPALERGLLHTARENAKPIFASLFGGAAERPLRFVDRPLDQSF